MHWIPCSKIECSGFYTCIDDLEGIVSVDAMDVLQQMEQTKENQVKECQEEIEWLKDEVSYYERDADNKLQQITAANQLVNNLYDMVLECQRMNRKKILDAILEISNQLDNY